MKVSSRNWPRCGNVDGGCGGAIVVDDVVVHAGGGSGSR